MRRAFVVFLLIPAVLGLLLGAGPTAAAAEAPIRSPEFVLHVDGFLVQLKAVSENTKVVLTLSRHHETAFYETAARITEDSVKARFGRLGELDYTFTPDAGKGPRCKGADGTREGTFEGTFEFTGENHYVTIDADRAHGSFELFPAEACKQPPAPAARADSAGQGGDAVTLQAATPGKRRVDYLLAFTVATGQGTRLVLNGFRAEKREGMLVERGVEVAARPGALRWDRAAGIARLTPPAPFRGSAELRRRAHGRPSWRGSLRIPVLGGEPIRLAGSRFRASIGTGSIVD